MLAAVNREPQEGGRKGLQFVGLGVEMVVPIVLFMYLGFRLDRHYETEPWWFLGGSILGIIVGFYNVFKRVGLLKPRNDQADRDGGS